MAKEIAYKVTVDTSESTVGTDKLTASIDELSKSVSEMSQQMSSGFKSAENSSKSASKGIAGIGSTIGGVVKSLGILGVAMAVFEYLKDLLMSNQRVADTFAKVFRTIDIIFGRVAKAVENLVDELRSLKKINLQSIAESFKNFGKELSNSADGALELAEMMVELEKKVKKSDATQRLYALTLQKEIEQQRQIRDNISLTIKERQDANDKIAVLIEKQLQKEKEVANQRLQLALLEQEVNNNNIESQIKVLEAKAELADIEERLTGVLSEQKTNREALRQEEDALLDERIEGHRQYIEFLREARIYSDYDEQIAALESQLDSFTEMYVNAREALREKLKQNNEGITEDQIQNHSDMLQLEEAYQKKWTYLVESEADIRRKIAEAETDERIALAFKLANGISSIVTGLAGQSKAAVAIQKTIAIAQIAVDTARSLSSAIASATQAAAATGPGAVVATPVFIATQIATVLAAVGQAVAVLNSAPGGGSASIPSVTAPTPTAVQAPQFNPVTTNTTQLGNTEQAELAPIQAFVVETELTGTQENVSQIESQATFG